MPQTSNNPPGEQRERKQCLATGGCSAPETKQLHLSVGWPAPLQLYFCKTEKKAKGACFGSLRCSTQMLLSIIPLLWRLLACFIFFKAGVLYLSTGGPKLRSVYFSHRSAAIPNMYHHAWLPSRILKISTSLFHFTKILDGFVHFHYLFDCVFL